MKKIFIPIELPDDYKFLAIQPWGSIHAFLNKPTIFKEGDEEYFDLQKGEIELSDLGEKTKDWKESVREI